MADGSTDDWSGWSDELDMLRALHAPYMEGLAAYLLMELPPWAPAPDQLDAWQTTAEDVIAPPVTTLVQHRRTRDAG